MSDTPRADAGHWLYEDEAGEGFDVVDFVLACQLERELNASEARVKELEEEREQHQRGGWWCRHGHWHAREGLSCCNDLSDDQDDNHLLRGEEGK